MVRESCSYSGVYDVNIEGVGRNANPDLTPYGKTLGSYWGKNLSKTWYSLVLSTLNLPPRLARAACPYGEA